MTIDLSDVDKSQAVTVEVLEEDDVYAVIVAADTDARTPILEFEGLSETESELAYNFVSAVFSNKVDID